MNQELRKYSNNELMNISILADLSIMLGKIVTEYPHTYQAIIDEIKKRDEKKRN